MKITAKKYLSSDTLSKTGSKTRFCRTHANKNKTNRNYSARFFISWFATGLVTMQGIVCTLRVTCTLCSWRNALQVNLLAYAITLAPLSTSPVVCVANYKVQKIYKMRKKLYNKKRYNMLCMKTGKVTNEKNRERIRNR